MMKMKKLVKIGHLRRSKGGVSSLIGELLVLAITVILFSGIFAYVLTLPPPDDTTYTDFEYTTPKWSSGNNYTYINVTNSGGQDLYDHSTGIYIFINETLYQNREFYIHDSETALGDVWEIGSVWAQTINCTSADSIRLMIIDKSTNTIVYDQFLTGLPNSSPVIGTRGTTPAVGVITEMASFYVYIVDANNDLTSTYVDMTAISDRLSGDDYIQLEHVSGILYVSNSITVTPGWRGGLVTIVAIDRAGNMATAKLTLQATEPEEGTETGYEPPNIIYSKNDGFNIFQKVDWQNHNFDGTPQYSFVLDSEDAAVVVVSKNLLNTEARNYLEVLNITTKQVIYSTEQAFVRYKFTSGFYVYTSYIDIDSPGFKANERYTVNVLLKDNLVPSHTISVAHEISTRNGGAYPQMRTYENRTDAITTVNFWNNDIVEVKVTSSSFPLNSNWFGQAGDVIIRDFTGGTQLHWAPAVPASGTPTYCWNGGPVSNVYKVDANTYAFAINLTAAKSGDPWSPGRNQAYILDFDMFTLKDSSNNYYQYHLSAIIFISSPTFSGGIAAGLVEGVSPNNGGGGQYYEGNEDWIQSSSMQYYVNDNSWIPPIPIDQDFWNAHRPQTLLCAGGDLNGDGQSREVVSYYASTNPHNYQTDNNFANTNDVTSWSRINLNVFNGQTWAVTQLRALNTGIEVKSLIMANIDQDNDLDVIYGMKNGSVMIGRNNGDDPVSWQWTCVHMGSDADNTAKSVVAMVAANLNPKSITNNITRGASIIVGCNDGTVYILNNTNGFGNWNYKWVPLQTLEKAKQISLPAASGRRLSSMAIGDLDHDGGWDVAVMRTSSIVGTGAQLTICYNIDIVDSTPTSSASYLTGNTNFPDKTNITIGRYLSRDNYPDIAIMSQDVGIFLLNHTYIAGVHTYTLLTPSSMTVDKFNTPASTTRPAQLSCMISGDIDGDGLDDLIVGTMRNPRGETINGTTYYNRMSKGAIFVVVNGNASPNGWQRYLVDDPGTPIRCLALMQ
jgi:hypothetical protein